MRRGAKRPPPPYLVNNNEKYARGLAQVNYANIKVFNKTGAAALSTLERMTEGHERVYLCYGRSVESPRRNFGAR